MNTFVWARGCGTKELIRLVGARYADGLSVRRVLDFGAGTNEEIADLWPNADEDLFLDSFTRPPERPRSRLIKQSAGEALRLRAICDGLTTLRPLQDDRSRLPDGGPLRGFVGRDEADYFRSHSPTLEAYWGAFFLAFEKEA